VITFHAIDEQGAAGDFGGALTPAVIEVCAAVAVMARGRRYRKPWVGYLVSSGGEAVGACAFKAVPAEGRVAVDFQTFDGFEGRGFATAMVRALVKIARTVRPGIVVTAQTPPHEGAATRVLEKCGFEYIGMIDGAEDGLVWEWRLETPGG
jgi:RimJ/RimL family protein N-acetyltransferase